MDTVGVFIHPRETNQKIETVQQREQNRNYTKHNDDYVRDSDRFLKVNRSDGEDKMSFNYNKNRNIEHHDDLEERQEERNIKPFVHRKNDPFDWNDTEPFGGSEESFSFAKIKCPNCGELNDENACYCKSCGEEL